MLSHSEEAELPVLRKKLVLFQHAAVKTLKTLLTFLDPLRQNQFLTDLNGLPLTS